jgi:hypothetical protein
MAIIYLYRQLFNHGNTIANLFGSVQVAGNLFGSGSNEQAAVRSAWDTVGINVRDLSVKEIARMKK